MVFRHPKYYAELRKRARQQAIQETVPHKDIEEANKLTSSQANEPKVPSLPSKPQASSLKSQAPRPLNQGTSKPSPYPGNKQQE